MADEPPWTPDPALVAVDLVILTIRDDQLCVLVVERGIDPYLGCWALPGGFVGSGENLEQAAVRELKEETSVDATSFHLEQLATYGDPARDPRARVIAVAYLALVPGLPMPRAGTDARAARWMPVGELSSSTQLAFDHGQIVADGLERARRTLEYTPLATAFCLTEFTISELRHVYEVVWDSSVDPRNFHRKVTGAKGFLVALGRRTTRDGGRPAELYRRGQAEILHPPMLMPRNGRR